MTQAEDRRDTFLMKMYDQMFNDINTHIIVVWQSIGVLIGSFTIMALIEKGIISVNYAVSLIVLLGGWFVAHLYDSSYWYNRNLAIITNIERQFLNKEDLKNIHYYFGKFRPNDMIEHLKIQYALGIGIISIFLIYHFCSEVFLKRCVLMNDPTILLPYFTLIIVIIYLFRLKSNTDKSYKEFAITHPYPLASAFITFNLFQP